MTNRPNVLEWLLVLLQFALFVLYFLTITVIDDFFVDVLKIFGAAPMVVGAVFIIWALLQQQLNLSVFPSPKETGRLITTGVYKLVRHPIYAGILFLAFGYAIYTQSFYKIIIAFILFVLFELKSSYEEQLLTEKFPAYAQYKLNTGKFFPFQIRLRKSSVDFTVSATEEEEEQ